MKYIIFTIISLSIIMAGCYGDEDGTDTAIEHTFGEYSQIKSTDWLSGHGKFRLRMHNTFFREKDIESVKVEILEI